MQSHTFESYEYNNFNLEIKQTEFIPFQQVHWPKYSLYYVRLAIKNFIAWYFSRCAVLRILYIMRDVSKRLRVKWAEKYDRECSSFTEDVEESKAFVLWNHKQPFRHKLDWTHLSFCTSLFRGICQKKPIPKIYTRETTRNHYFSHVSVETNYHDLWFILWGAKQPNVHSFFVFQVVHSSSCIPESRQSLHCNRALRHLTNRAKNSIASWGLLKIATANRTKTRPKSTEKSKIDWNISIDM